MYARILPVLALGLLFLTAGLQPLHAQQQHSCQAEFDALREELQAKGKALQEAGRRKAATNELCVRVSSYANSEAKMLNFLERKTAECGIQPEAFADLKKTRAKTIGLQTKICDAANP